MLAGEGRSGFNQGIAHSGSLLLHGLERFANYRWAHAHGTEIANFFYFEKVGEGVGGRGSDEAGALPVRQLARREMKNSQ